MSSSEIKETEKELKDKIWKLQREINLLRSHAEKHKIEMAKYRGLIRNFNIHMKRIRDNIDYLLEHNYSQNMGGNFGKY